MAVAGLVLATLTSILGLYAARADASHAAPTELLVHGLNSAGKSEVHLIELRDEHWSSSEPLDASAPRQGVVWPSADVGIVFSIGEPIAIERFYPDSGQVDIALSYPDGHEERITRARGDDVPQAWAPDGTTLLIETSRWGQYGHRAIATLSLATRQVQRLTSGGSRSMSDLHPSWSPDGSRIAFVRQYYDIRAADFCTVDADGARERCRTIPGRSLTGLGGWLDARRVIAWTDSSGVARSEEVRVSTDSVRPLPFPGNTCAVSPNGRWIGCTSTGGTDIQVAPTSSPLMAREIRLPTGLRSDRFAWSQRSADNRAIDRIRIMSPKTRIQAGVGFLLTVEAFTISGERVDVPDLRWMVLDTATGSISKDGLLVARPGVVRVRASAGGWRSAEIELRATAEVNEVLVREQWTEGFQQRWRMFGTPHPSVIRQNGKSRFWNRGDGDHSSGAYLVRRFDVRDGLWVEADISTAITAIQWQVAMLEMGVSLA